MGLFLGESRLSLNILVNPPPTPPTPPTPTTVIQVTLCSPLSLLSFTCTDTTVSTHYAISYNNLDNTHYIHYTNINIYIYIPLYNYIYINTYIYIYTYIFTPILFCMNKKLRFLNLLFW